MKDRFAGWVMACLLGVSPAAAAPADFPHAPIVLPDDAGEAEFHVLGDRAVVTLRRTNGSVVPLRVVDDVDDALTVLADRRLAFAWPALLAWAGDDLTALRDRTVERSRAASEMGLPGSMPKADTELWNGDATVTATLQLARALKNAGQVDQAVAMLRAALLRVPKDASGNNAREMLVIRLANVLFDTGDNISSLTMLESESANPVRQAGERANLDINLAAMLVRNGQYQRGLALLDLVARQFFGEEPVGDGFRVPDSQANFAWIRACALNGLGQRAKARALLDAMVETTPPEVPGQIGNVAFARIRLLYCTGDSAGLAGELAALLTQAPPGGGIFTMLQPSGRSYTPERATLAAALAQPVLVKAMAGRVRPLVPQFSAAVSSWSARP